MMDRTYQTELRRLFLIRNLPEPLTRASQHLQIFDNYIENTRLRLRRIRAPHTKEQSWILEHRFPADANNLQVWKLSEMFLREGEYQIFEPFEGREIRKNRYFYEFDERQIIIDLYLGELWGLITAKASFETETEMKHFETPPFAIHEITNNSFFMGENLVGKKFADVQSEFEKLALSHQIITEVSDE